MDYSEDYVSYDIAEMLDSVGYDGEYHAWYAKGEVDDARLPWFSYGEVLKWEKRDKGHLFCGNAFYTHALKPKSNLIKAPTVSSVLKWLRKKYDVFVGVCMIDHNTVYMGGERYYCHIYTHDRIDWRFSVDEKKCFVEYKDAVNYALEYIFVNFEKSVFL